jgi:hypothetical protein
MKTVKPGAAGNLLLWMFGGMVLLIIACLILWGFAG